MSGTATTLSPSVVAMLGEGPELTEDQEHLLGILLDPANDPWQRLDTEEETLDEFTAFNGIDIDEDRCVAERLREHHNRQDGYGSFDFEHIRDGDGCVSAYNVLLSATNEPGLWLTYSNDIKYLGGGYEEATGLRAALRTAETLEGDWCRLRATAERVGLFTEGESPTTKPSVWPETDEEKVAFVDWQYEVANADTCVGFRDWFTSRESEDVEACREVPAG